MDINLKSGAALLVTLSGLLGAWFSGLLGSHPDLILVLSTIATVIHNVLPPVVTSAADGK